jgi:cell division protease FtsH
LKAISLSVKEKCGVDIYFDESINDVIYKNGVFPSQGVRPVLSTIGGVVENNIPQVIIGSRFQANNIIMSYRDGKIEAYSNDMLIWSQEYHGHINQLLIDQRKKIDINCLVAVHESGHAIANALLMGTVFDDLISVSANDEGGVGAYLNSLDVFSKDEYRNMITISMCGRVAEKKVFNVITSGASQDIEDATELANKMIREYGMDKFYSYINSSNGYANNDVESTNSLIENIIASHYEQAENLINANYGLLLKLSDVLIKKEKMTGDELIEFFKDNGIDVMKTKDAKSKIRYREIFDRELGNFIGSE